MSNDDIINYMKNIETRLEKIEILLKSSQKSARKMDDHIEFIDGVYDVVKKPFAKILSMCSSSTIEIQDKPRMLEELDED